MHIQIRVSSADSGSLPNCRNEPRPKRKMTMHTFNLIIIPPLVSTTTVPVRTADDDPRGAIGVGAGFRPGITSAVQPDRSSSRDGIAKRTLGGSHSISSSVAHASSATARSEIVVAVAVITVPPTPTFVFGVAVVLVPGTKGSYTPKSATRSVYRTSCDYTISSLSARQV